MAIILNLETATEICSVCLSRDLEILAICESAKPFDHARTITSLIEKCLKEANVVLHQLDAVAVSAGPGSYTSLRVGASTAKGICYALDLPLISVDTLESIALAARKKVKSKSLYCPMIDARRMEVYCAIFDSEGILVQPSSALIINQQTFDEFFAKKQQIVFCGNGAPKIRKIVSSQLAIYSDTVCTSSNLPDLSFSAYQAEIFTDLVAFSPNYQKSPNVTTSNKNPFPCQSKEL